MGVTYKLTDEVVQFIINQRQVNPFSSCRQLAESVSQKFGLNLSKSSVHDVLKESGITTPRGRKPKDKFEIPHEKKKQIQVSLSQIKLLPDPAEVKHFKPEPSIVPSELSAVPSEPPVILPDSPVILPDSSVILSEAKDLNNIDSGKDSSVSPQNDSEIEPKESAEKEDVEISSEYEGAGKIFHKAALWDLGIFSEGNIKETDWIYFLTYSKGVKVDLENNRNYFIELPLPLERCIREVADGLVNNINPFVVHKVSDEELFKASMENKVGYKISNISIVDQQDHIIVNFDNIMDNNRCFELKNILFVESFEKNAMARAKTLFFTQIIENTNVIDNIMNLSGYDAIHKYENVVSLFINDSYENKMVLQEAIEKLNGMYLRDEEGRIVSVKIVIQNEVKDLKVSEDPSATPQNELEKM